MSLQLDHMNESTLFDLMRNESGLPEARLGAAKVLYQRNSGHVNSPEFQPFKALLMDKTISEMWLRDIRALQEAHTVLENRIVALERSVWMKFVGWLRRMFRHH